MHQNPASFRDGSQPRPTDIFIAVMGVTGAGKSTFISQCCDKTPVIGHDLQACTRTVDVYPCKISPAATVYLIDTPGFDDTSRSDNEVLCEIASWLTASYTTNIRLNGIIYLHRISDIKMQGSAKKNLFMFQKLCGPNALKNVILATTMWDRVSEIEGKAREKELTSTPDFWGWMVNQGSRVFRHSGDKTSAFKLVQTLVKDNTQITLALQQQMTNENKSLDETDAGQELRAEITNERKRFEKCLAEVQKQTAEALKDRDKASAIALREVQDDYRDRIGQLELAGKNLKTDLEKMHMEKYQQLEARLQEVEDRHHEQLQKMEQDRLQRESEMLRDKAAAEQRELEVASALKKLQLQEDVPKYAGPSGVRTSTAISRPNPEVSLSIVGEDYCFSGPKMTVGNWRPRDYKIPEDGDEKRIIALGLSESWITIGKNGTIQCGGLEAKYPTCRLIEDVGEKDTKTWFGRISQISLGSKECYFAKGEKKAGWILPGKLADLIDKQKPFQQHAFCAFGRDDAYIAQLNDWRLLWDLKGRYPGLGEYLKNLSGGLRAAVLSLTDAKCMVIPDRGTAWLKCKESDREDWESWVTAHYDITF